MGPELSQDIHASRGIPRILRPSQRTFGAAATGLSLIPRLLLLLLLMIMMMRLLLLLLVEVVVRCLLLLLLSTLVSRASPLPPSPAEGVKLSDGTAA